MSRPRKRTARRPPPTETAVEPAAKRARSQPSGSLSDYLSRQRSLADISLRKIIERSGIPGAVLKEIEGGLKNPGQTVLSTLAGALRLSAETLYLQAGVLDPRDVEDCDAVRELYRDPYLTEHQRAVVVEVYKAFRRGNQAKGD